MPAPKIFSQKNFTTSTVEPSFLQAIGFDPTDATSPEDLVQRSARKRRSGAESYFAENRGYDLVYKGRLLVYLQGLGVDITRRIEALSETELEILIQELGGDPNFVQPTRRRLNMDRDNATDFGGQTDFSLAKEIALALKELGVKTKKSYDLAGYPYFWSNGRVHAEFRTKRPLYYKGARCYVRIPKPQFMCKKEGYTGGFLLAPGAQLGPEDAKAYTALYRRYSRLLRKQVLRNIRYQRRKARRRAFRRPSYRRSYPARFPRRRYRKSYRRGRY